MDVGLSSGGITGLGLGHGSSYSYCMLLPLGCMLYLLCSLSCRKTGGNTAPWISNFADTISHHWDLSVVEGGAGGPRKLLKVRQARHQERVVSTWLSLAFHC